MDVPYFSRPLFFPGSVNYRVEANGELVLDNRKFYTTKSSEKFILTYNGTDDNGNEISVTERFEVEGENVIYPLIVAPEPTPTPTPKPAPTPTPKPTYKLKCKSNTPSKVVKSGSGICVYDDECAGYPKSWDDCTFWDRVKCGCSYKCYDYSYKWSSCSAKPKCSSGYSKVKTSRC